MIQWGPPEKGVAWLQDCPLIAGQESLWAEGEHVDSMCDRRWSSHRTAFAAGAEVRGGPGGGPRES